LGIGALFIGAIIKIGAFAVYTYLHQFAFFELDWQLYWVWILLFFCDDFTFYWHHRLSHQIRLLLSAHVNHHSSIKYNLGTALRQSWTENLYRYGWYIWLPLLALTLLWY